MKKILKKIFHKLGLGVVSQNRLQSLLNTEELSQELLSSVAEIDSWRGESKAQLYQDLFVLLATGFKQHGFFVEFGATNGVDLSNTHLLEKHYSWNGILAEPAISWHKQLIANRNCKLEFDCVWHTSEESLEFFSSDIGELSTIGEYVNSDGLANKRTAGERYSVNTISLNDLLVKHEAPEIIDYLSIDTEGSELEILKAFDFDHHKIAIIHVEHNYHDLNRRCLNELLSGQGYSRRHQHFSKWDDWYYRDDLCAAYR